LTTCTPLQLNAGDMPLLHIGEVVAVSFSGPEMAIRIITKSPAQEVTAKIYYHPAVPYDTETESYPCQLVSARYIMVGEKVSVFKNGTDYWVVGSLVPASSPYTSLVSNKFYTGREIDNAQWVDLLDNHSAGPILWIKDDARRFLLDDFTVVELEEPVSPYDKGTYANDFINLNLYWPNFHLPQITLTPGLLNQSYPKQTCSTCKSYGKETQTETGGVSLCSEKEVNVPGISENMPCYNPRPVRKTVVLGLPEKTSQFERYFKEVDKAKKQLWSLVTVPSLVTGRDAMEPDPAESREIIEHLEHELKSSMADCNNLKEKLKETEATRDRILKNQSECADEFYTLHEKYRAQVVKYSALAKEYKILKERLAAKTTERPEYAALLKLRDDARRDEITNLKAKLTNANAHANSWKIGFTRQVENSKDIGDKHAVLVEEHDALADPFLESIGDNAQLEAECDDLRKRLEQAEVDLNNALERHRNYGDYRLNDNPPLNLHCPHCDRTISSVKHPYVAHKEDCTGVDLFCTELHWKLYQKRNNK